MIHIKWLIKTKLKREKNGNFYNVKTKRIFVLFFLLKQFVCKRLYDTIYCGKTHYIFKGVNYGKHKSCNMGIRGYG